jgi:protein-S-isoprenylcysteine O-methyltransferase Ste14
MGDEINSQALATRPFVPRLLLTILAGLFAISFIAVAAYGFGSLQGMLSDPARATVCGGLFLLAVFTPICGCNLSSGEQIDLSNDWIFAVMVIAGIAMGWAAAHYDRRNIYTFGGHAVRWTGVSIFGIGALLRVLSILALGSRFTVWVALQTDHHLTTTGLYRSIRHPSYTGAALTVLGWAITFRSVIGVALAFVVLLPLLSRIDAEEQLLVEEFGDEYRQYQRRTWRLAPFVY